MGVINHSAVIATTWNHEALERANDFINSHPEMACLFSIVKSMCNGYTTVILSPDGGKELGELSAEGDELRKAFIEMLESNKYEDGSNSWSWVEVSYGELGQGITQGNNINLY